MEGVTYLIKIRREETSKMDRGIGKSFVQIFLLVLEEEKGSTTHNRNIFEGIFTFILILKF